MCENHQGFEDWESLHVSLEIGFRHLDSRRLHIPARLTHTENHRGLVNVVFKSPKSEVIVDLLYAWTVRDYSLGKAQTLLGICTGHIIGLHHLVPFSSRLRRLVIRSVELIGYKVFGGVEVERFIDLLEYLHVTVEDMDKGFKWAKILLVTLQSSKGVQHLSHWYWELLVELSISWSQFLRGDITYSPQITTFLTEAQEWSKLECWMGTVWMMWPPGTSGVTEGDLAHSTLLLFHQRPGAAQKLEQWMERWSQKHGENIPEPFQQICKQAYEPAQLVAS